MISKTKIGKGQKRKKNPELVETIKISKKKNFLELAKKLAYPNRFHKNMNLDELNKLNEKKIIVVGKILGSGNISKKMEVSALGYSKKAKDKLEKAGCKINTIKQEIEKNNKLEGVKIL